MSRSMQPDKTGDILHTLSANISAIFENDGYATDAEVVHFFTSLGIVLNIDDGEFNIILRKKLFRLEAAASSRYSEEQIAVGRKGHVCWLLVIQ